MKFVRNFCLVVTPVKSCVILGHVHHAIKTKTSNVVVEELKKRSSVNCWSQPILDVRRNAQSSKVVENIDVISNVALNSNTFVNHRVVRCCHVESIAVKQIVTLGIVAHAQEFHSMNYDVNVEVLSFIHPCLAVFLCLIARINAQEDINVIIQLLIFATVERNVHHVSSSQLNGASVITNNERLFHAIKNLSVAVCTVENH